VCSGLAVCLGALNSRQNADPWPTACPAALLPCCLAALPPAEQTAAAVCCAALVGAAVALSWAKAHPVLLVDFNCYRAPERCACPVLARRMPHCQGQAAAGGAAAGTRSCVRVNLTRGACQACRGSSCTHGSHTPAPLTRAHTHTHTRARTRAQLEDHARAVRLDRGVHKDVWRGVAAVHEQSAAQERPGRRDIRAPK
jgi:hypothetical protein